MSLYSDYLAPERYREKQPVSDGIAITVTLIGVALFVTALIGGSRLLLLVL